MVAFRISRAKVLFFWVLSSSLERMHTICFLEARPIRQLGHIEQYSQQSSIVVLVLVSLCLFVVVVSGIDGLLLLLLGCETIPHRPGVMASHG
jgi:hypothetical protein